MNRAVFPIGLGFAMCVLCVVGALALHKASGSGLDPRELGRAVMLILIWQLVAIPVSLVVGYLGFGAVFLMYHKRQDNSGVMALELFISFATYLVSSAIAYKTWQWYFQHEKPL